jgi:hypothetical protein
VRDPIGSLLDAVERDVGGIAIVWCPDLGTRAWLVDELESLVSSDRRPFRATSLEEALSEPDRLALWVPDNEAEAVLDLDAGRDLLRNEDRPRTRPIVLFLLRDGDGARALRTTATSLWSATGGNLVDPEELAEIDVAAERRSFEEDLGKTPEAWLEAWRSGSLPHTAENFAVAYRAKLLESP